VQAWQESWPAWLLLAVAVGMVTVSATAWRRRAIPAAPWLAALCLAVAVWALADGLGAAAVSLGLKTSLSKIECLAALAVGPCWLLMTRAFTRRPPLPRWCTAFVWAMPVAFVPIIAANWHGLMWPHITVVHTTAGFEGRYTYGAAVWAEVAYSYVLGVVGIVWLVQASRAAPRAYRRQAFVLAALAMLPLITNIVDLAGLSPFRQDIDLAPLAFGAGVVFLGWMLLRGGFLELAPLARDALLRTLPDGVLVVDQHDCVIEANRAAVELLRAPRGRLLGRLETALAGWPPLVEACRRPMPFLCEIRLDDPDGGQRGPGDGAAADDHGGGNGHGVRHADGRRLEVRVTALQDSVDDARGRLVTLHDITERVRLSDQVRDLHLGNLRALSSALNAKDYYTFGHAGRVAAYVMLLGRELGWSDERLATVQDVAYLHDIGKIGVSDRVLRKAGPLNAEEWELMRQHPTISAEIVAPLFESELIAGVRQHHERFGGGGYPDGLAGDEITDVARALCVADSYDAMSYERPYRGALSYAECCAELRRCSGSQFDPAMVTAFLRALARLEERRRTAAALAAEAARLVDPAEHSLLRTRADEERPSYGAMTTTLLSFRRSYPSVRLLTTFAMVDRECVTVLDPCDGDDDRSHCGDPWLPCDQLAAALEGRDLEANALNADQFGVWISGFAPIRAADGTIAGALSIDLPAVESPGLQQLHTDLSRTLASMLQATTRRGSRVELEAISDGLTGLYNHRYLHERLEEELVRLRERENELSLLYIDVDRFKTLNDARGHKAGDEALRRVARILEQCSRRVDLAARYGGDEFVLALVESGETGAREVAERICRSVADTVDGERRAVTVSIGIANFPRDARTKDELLDKADWAMNAAKRSGRDRVMAFSDDLAREPASETSRL
jgi:diguanylate cyclase (GGDEF)-like protein